MTTHHDHAHATDPTPAPEFWEQRYLGYDEDWGRRPNPPLVDVLSELAIAPGRVLELGAGHGGDSLWLAREGWTVTAVDVSPTALRRVDEAAAAEGLGNRIRTERHDLAETFPEGAFDLVTATYFQSPLAFDRADILRRAAAATVPGAAIVLIDHASAPSWSDHGPGGFPTPEEALADTGLDLHEWSVELCAGRDRESIGPHGETGMVTDTLIALRKRT